MSKKQHLLESAEPVTRLRETLEPSKHRVTLETVTDATGKKTRMARVEIATVDVVNRNRRFYPRSAYEAANEAAKADMDSGKLWGLLEHPGWMDGAKGQLERICFKFTELGIDGSTVYGRASIPPTEAGDTVAALLEHGIAVGISTNGSASQNWVLARTVDPSYPFPDEEIAVIADDFRYYTIDAVGDPSNPGGKATKETVMKEWLKKLAKSNPALAKECEAIITANPESEATLEAMHGLSESAPAPVPPAPAIIPAMQSEEAGLLARTVASLQSQVKGLEADRQNERRDNIALRALNEAALPVHDIVKEGDVVIDLNKIFEADLIAYARAAESDVAATEMVNRKILERRHSLRFVAPVAGAKPMAKGTQPPKGSTERIGVEKPALDATRRPIVSSMFASLNIR